MPGPESVIAYALANPINRAVLDALPGLAVPDAWLVSGCVFQSVWNGLTGRASNYGILDYDVFYFDPDLSFEAEDRVVRRCAAAFAELGVEVQVRNQARVHLWYPEKFNRPYPPLGCAVESLNRFLAPACAVGLQRHDGEYAVAAPFGLDDVFSMTIRRNPSVGGLSDEYDAKTARWKAVWPEITVLPWS
jgi:hypothetical protein